MFGIFDRILKIDTFSVCEKIGAHLGTDPSAVQQQKIQRDRSQGKRASRRKSDRQFIFLAERRNSSLRKNDKSPRRVIDIFRNMTQRDPVEEDFRIILPSDRAENIQPRTLDLPEIPLGKFCRDPVEMRRNRRYLAEPFRNMKLRLIAERSPEAIHFISVHIDDPESGLTKSGFSV